jgi:hypothetical protein
MGYAALCTAALPQGLADKAKAYFDGQDPALDWTHTLRMMALCERIGPKEH